MVLLSASGMAPSEIAVLLRYDPVTVRRCALGRPAISLRTYHRRRAETPHREHRPLSLTPAAIPRGTR
jgi:hypothetical protein